MADLVIAGNGIDPGTMRSLELPFARLPTGSAMPVPMIVARGTGPGPTVFLTAAVHGDELNGVEIVRQVMDRLSPKALRGAVLAVPVVNVFGFIAESRYLPDRRDLNRSFPGSKTGSLAARLAYLLMTEVVAHSTHGIDLHTGSNHRSNLPHIRASLGNSEQRRLAEAFGTRVIVDSASRSGSLRQAVDRIGVPCLLYEAGEAQRLNLVAVRAGVEGVLRVLGALDMIDDPPPASELPLSTAKTSWVRARRAGLFRMTVQLGSRVTHGDELGRIRDSFGEVGSIVTAAAEGIVLGAARNPLVNRGDALVHIAHLPTDGRGPQA